MLYSLTYKEWLMKNPSIGWMQEQIRQHGNVSELATKSGVSRAAIYRLIKGERTSIRLETMISLMDALGIVFHVREAADATR